MTKPTIRAFVRSAFVTGANRGLGLEITRRLLSRGDTVFAACRSPGQAAELRGLDPSGGRLTILPLDLTKPSTIYALTRELRGLTDKLDFLFNVAGTKGNLTPDPDENLSRRLGEIEPDSMAEIYAINLIGPLLIVQELLPLLAGTKIVNISSSMGSNGLMNRGDWYGYRASKAALNIVTHALSFDLREIGAIAVSIHPGWVNTAMGTDEAPYDVVDNTVSIMRVVDGLTERDSGKFFNWKGEALPW